MAKLLIFARCRSCGSKLSFDDRPEIGQLIMCPDCDTYLEVINNNPLELDWADDDSDDDDYDYDTDDDDDFSTDYNVDDEDDYNEDDED